MYTSQDPLVYGSIKSIDTVTVWKHQRFRLSSHHLWSSYILGEPPAQVDFWRKKYLMYLP